MKLVTNEKCRRLLDTCGKSAFVSLFPYRNNDEKMLEIMHSNGDACASCQQRLRAIHSIKENVYEKEALLAIVGAKKVPWSTRILAFLFFIGYRCYLLKVFE